MTPQPVTLEMIFQGTASLRECAAFTIAAVFIILAVLLPAGLVLWDAISCRQPQQED